MVTGNKNNQFMPKPSQRTLRCYYNWLAKDGLPAPRGGWPKAILDAGYDGVQLIEPLSMQDLAECREVGLAVCGSGRVNVPADATRLAKEARQAGLECLTLHVGWGLEEDAAAGDLIEAVLNASAQFSIPMYVETHRATIFQDMWRTVQFVHRYPDLLFNGDFSHWYTGLEMVYGGFEKKVAFIQPVIERVRFMHGRIGTPGCIQVEIGELQNARSLQYVQHFRRLWIEIFRAYLTQPEGPPFFCFAAELLAPDIYYARVFKGAEESDRWQQSLVLTEIARECFAEAQLQAVEA